MMFKARSLAATVAVMAVVGMAGCVTVTAPNSPNTGASPRPSASASTGNNTGANGGGTTTSPAPMASAAAAFKCETPEAVTLAAGNTDFATAQTVSACAAITASLAGDDYRFFKVTIPDGTYDGRLKVTVNESNADYLPNVRVFDAAKADIDGGNAADSTATPLVFQQDVSAGKDYYVRINQPSEAGEATIRFEFVPTVDMYERNDTFETAKALTSGATVNVVNFAGHDTMDGDDVDFFRIDVPAGKTQIMVKIANKSTAAEGQLWNVRLLNAAKEDLDGGGSANSQADVNETFTVESAGAYYLRLTGGTNSAVASQLTVTVQ